MIYEIPVEAKPNQFFSTSLDGITWGITLETRLNGLYISLVRGNELVLSNRVCRNRVSVGYGFSFIDIEENKDPEYSGLGVRYILVWTDEV